VNLNGWGVKELDKKDAPKQSEHGVRLAPKDPKDKNVLLIAVASAEAAALWLERLSFAAALASPAVFGVPLRVAFAKGGYKRCPALVSRMIEFLERSEALGMSGIFRVSAGQGDVMRLREAYQDGTDPEPIIAAITDLNIASHLLKLYFRELPDPLLTHERYTAFVEAANNVAKIAEICASLPREHLYTLQYLMKFLKKIAARSAENMMTSRNLAVVFGPTILSPSPTSSAATAAAVQAEPVIQVCQTMIDSYDAIFAKIEREAIADAERPRPRPAPIIAISRGEAESGDDDDDDKDKKAKDKEKEKRERRKSGTPATMAASGSGEAMPSAPAVPLLGMPLINPGAVRLKPVGSNPADIRRPPRTDDGPQETLGPHMLKKSVSAASPAAMGAAAAAATGGGGDTASPGGIQQTELMAKLAARSQHAAAAPAPASAPQPEGDSKPRPVLEGRPVPQRKPLAHLGVTFPGPRPAPRPSLPPGALRPSVQPKPAEGSSTPTPTPAPAPAPASAPTSTSTPSSPPVPPKTSDAEPTTLPSATAAVAASLPVGTKDLQRKSLPQPRMPHSDESSTAAMVDALRSQILELQNTVAKLTDQLSALEEKHAAATAAPEDTRMATLEAKVAEQGEQIARQEEQLKNMSELLEELARKKRERKEKKDANGEHKRGHAREKSKHHLKKDSSSGSAPADGPKEGDAPRPPSDSPTPPPPPEDA